LIVLNKTHRRGILGRGKCTVVIGNAVAAAETSPSFLLSQEKKVISHAETVLLNQEDNIA
jgi:hypothetical protein